MSWLLFMDESGHDHRQMPYEVRGGVAMRDEQLWPLVQAVERLELQAFGTRLSQFRKEIKGSKLLDKDRYKWAAQGPRMQDEERRKACRRFLTKGLEKKTPARDDFTAYGQACLEMARGMFQLLSQHKAHVMASAIPQGADIAPSDGNEELLRKDHVFLFERFFYLLEREKQHGLIVMDEVEKVNDRRFVRRMEAYFTKTHTGRYRTSWIVPSPFFVSSDMAIPVQAADLAIYCLNWGFRLPSRGMDAPTRPEIADEFGPWLHQLQFYGDAYKDGTVYPCYGITYVPDPTESRKG